MTSDPFEIDISRQIWETRYRYAPAGKPVDCSVEDSWRRVASTLAELELEDRAVWEDRFYRSLADFRFLPGGRILAGAGTGYEVTLFNCFVMGRIEDSMAGICEGLKQATLTMQQGGGVGFDFSTLRPEGSVARRVGSMASGPVSFMRVWDSMCATLISSAYRRGAMMATLRCDHPDIEMFIDAKRDAGELRNFNLSVLVSDAFMQAVADNESWPLVFPVEEAIGDDQLAGEDKIIQRRWSRMREALPCRVHKTVSARELWERIMRASYDVAEPGILFIDRINRQNNLYYREEISATNPCGEIPLPPYGACNLGSINLTRFVRAAFRPEATLDYNELDNTVGVAVRMLNHIIDVSGFPLDEQTVQARGTRRIGLGITGLADILIMLGLNYGTATACEYAAGLMRRIRDGAYRESIRLAKVSGAFPFYDRDAYSNSPFVENLPADIRQEIFDNGIRNSHLTAIAPAGTISLFANNVSSGIEPVFDFRFQRRIRNFEGEYKLHEVVDYAWRRWQQMYPDETVPDYFVKAHSLSPQQHLAMQAALQPYVDSAVSKTINVPGDYAFEDFRNLYLDAYRLGLKGCTTFRPNPVTGSILQGEDDQFAVDPDAGCCGLERESG